MKLVHELQGVPGTNNTIHRLVDLDHPESHKLVKWVGYRTPAVWEHCFFDETRSYYVAVTDHFRGSEEFPYPDHIYYVCGVPIANKDLPQFQMARRIWRYVEIFLESIPTFEDPSKNTDKTYLQRLEDFRKFFNESVDTELREEGKVEV